MEQEDSIKSEDLDGLLAAAKAILMRGDIYAVILADHIKLLRDKLEDVPPPQMRPF